MSGFLAAVDRSGAPIDQDVCRAQLAAIEDVGPDGTGAAWPHPFVCLAHCKRNDTPEAVGTCMPLRRGDVVLVADLRLDNRAELLARLGQRDCEQPDGELLLDAYLAWGDECVDRLIGEFAFALWDDRARTLFCARDPLGDRALYYATAGQVVVCSNEIRAVRSWPGVSLDVDELSVAGALVRHGLFMRAASSTFFRHVHQVPPGHHLVVAKRDIRTSCYWSIDDLAARPLPRASLPDHHENFRERFRAAVVSRLRSASPVGSHLSGGLDSTSVACVAAGQLQASKQRLPCFTHVARGSIANVSSTRTVRDEAFVEAAARQYPNMVLHWVSGKEREILDGLEAQFHYIGVAHPNHYQTWWDGISAQAGESGLGTVLTGVSGNLTASYVGRPAGWGWRRWLSRLAGRDRGLNWEQGSSLRRDLAERLEVDDLVRQAQARQGPASGLGRGMNGLYRSYGIGRFGVELRDPMGDRRIVEFCLRAPQALFRRDGQSRLLIRDALRGVVPDLVLDRRSRQLQSADWVERSAEALPTLLGWVSTLSKSELAASFIDWRTVRGRLERPPVARGDTYALASWNNGILGAIAVGRFLAWVEDGCPAPPAPRAAESR